MSDKSRFNLDGATFSLESESILDVDVFESGTVTGTGAFRTICALMTGEVANSVNLVCLSVQSISEAADAAFRSVSEFSVSVVTIHQTVTAITSVGEFTSKKGVNLAND